MENICKKLVLFVLAWGCVALADKAYVANLDGGVDGVAIVDTATNKVIGTVTDPFGQMISITDVIATPDGKTAYASSQATNTISIINTATDTVTGFISVVSAPTDMAITPNGSKIYVINSDNTIRVINVATNTIIAAIPGIAGTAIEVDPTGTKVYVGDTVTGLVSIIDVATDTVVGTVTGAFDGPQSIAFTSDGLKAYIANNSNNTVSIVNVPVNMSTGFVIDPFASFNSPRAVIFTLDNVTAYVANQGGNSISVIHAATNIVTNVIAGAFSAPFNFAITPDGKTLYVINFSATANVVIIDIATNTIIGIVADPLNQIRFPQAMAIIPNILPPSNVSACILKKVFLAQTDIVNIITFSSSAIGLPAVSYRVYRDASLRDLLGVVPANGSLRIEDHNRRSDIVYTYYIVAISEGGLVSSPVSVTAAHPCSCNVKA